MAVTCLAGRPVAAAEAADRAERPSAGGAGQKRVRVAERYGVRSPPSGPVPESGAIPARRAGLADGMCESGLS